MNDVFVAEFRQAETIVKRAIKCPDVAAIALTLIWLSWSRRPDVGINAHAWYGIRQALSGRDFPGVQPSHTDDAWEHLDHWQGAGMERLIDPKARPVDAVIARETFELLSAESNCLRRRATKLLAEGGRTKEVAAALRVTPGRISQIRQELFDSAD